MIRHQKYASQAHKLVSEVSAGASTDAAKKKLAKEYKARAENFPIMVLQSGLLQAVGFLRAKATGKGEPSDAYKRYWEDLVSLLQWNEKNQSAIEFHQKLIDGTDIAQYRNQTRECLVAAGWLKRFAQTLLSDELLTVNQTPNETASPTSEAPNG